MTTPAPKNIKQINETTLGISWNDGLESEYAVKKLRETKANGNQTDNLNINENVLVCQDGGDRYDELSTLH